MNHVCYSFDEKNKRKKIGVDARNDKCVRIWYMLHHWNKKPLQKKMPRISNFFFSFLL